MRKLVYLVATTLDGFISDAADSDPTGTVFDPEGAHAAPLMAEYPEMIPTHIRPMLGLTDTAPQHFDTVLEGRGSYEIGLAAGVTNAYRHLRHLVFSTTLPAVDDPLIELVRTDPAERIRELKAEDGLDIWLCGGGTLAGALRAEIDELHLKVYPVTLGKGVPLFGTPARDAKPTADHFALRSATPFDSGVSLMIYERRHRPGQ